MWGGITCNSKRTIYNDTLGYIHGWVIAKNDFHLFTGGRGSCPIRADAKTQIFDQNL